MTYRREGGVGRPRMRGAAIAGAPTPPLYLSLVNRRGRGATPCPFPFSGALSPPVTPELRVFPEAIPITGPGARKQAHGGAVGPIAQPVLIVRKLDQPQPGNGRLIERYAISKDVLASTYDKRGVWRFRCTGRSCRRNGRQDSSDEGDKRKRRTNPHQLSRTASNLLASGLLCGRSCSARAAAARAIRGLRRWSHRHRDRCASVVPRRTSSN
jgi:hypothetical protein